MQRFAAYLKSHPEMTEIQKRRVMFALLNKFAFGKNRGGAYSGWLDQRPDRRRD